MKKTLLGTVAAALVLTGCSSMPFTKPASSTNQLPVIQGTQQGGYTAQRWNVQPAPASSDVTDQFTCSDNAKITAKYPANQNRAILTVTAPTWQLTNQEIILEQATSGSGMRYINHTNPASLYEWQSKGVGSDNILSATANGKTFVLSCR